MACCGNKRAQASSVAGLATPSAPVRSVQAPDGSSIGLRYLRRDPLSLRGPRSGRIYHVRGTNALVAVHPDDAPALLRTGLFAADVASGGDDERTEQARR
jgi:hypothetical protein